MNNNNDTNEQGKAEKIKDTGKKAWEKSKEGIKHLSDNIQHSLEDETNEKTYAAVSYVPFLGPVIVYLFKKKQKFSKWHAKNAAYLQGTAFIVWLVIWLLENIPFISHILKAIRFIPHITNALLYTNIVAFIVFSFIGIFKALKNNKWSTPLLNSFIEKYLLKSEKNKP